MSSILRVVPRSWLSPFTDLRSGERIVATLELSFFLDQGRAEIEGVPYELLHPRFFGLDYTMRRSGKVVAETHADGFFRPDYPIAFEGRSYNLMRQGFWSPRMVLRDAEGEALGSIYPDGFLTRRATAELPEELPLSLRVFAIWLALVAWRQRRRRS